jgi:glycosyltransferase 2 family protein
VAWVALVLVAAGLALAQRWEEVRGQLGLLRPGAVAASVILAVAGVAVSGLVWRALLAGLGSPLGVRAGAPVFFVGQLGKYVPGSVWPVLAQASLGRDRGVPRRASVAAAVLFMWVHLLTGAALAAVLLPVAGVLPWPVALAALPLLALLAPGLMGRAVSAALRLARREPLPALPTAGAVTQALGWAALMWAAYGLHLVVAAAPLGATGTASAAATGAGASLALATGAYAAAWCAGFLFVIAPAGAGIREVVLVGLLAPSVGTDAALVLALVSRLGVTVGDLGLGLAALAFGGRTGRPRRHRQPPR